ncbi:hypothetical protein [Pseudovibrio ascidiaceicola]|uniref:hypothetical protein n=1 Tax=Pseudovibrio ascidiaceicola TaxID=285279 RepID=UPI000D695AB7|nr:hypothetical protein [Pseudovibrio ascidiaceicola]
MKKGPTYQELEQATRFAAWIVVEYGEQYAPIFDRLEAELNKLSPRDRAAQFLKSNPPQTLEGGVKAIR